MTWIISWGSVGRQPRLALLEGVPEFTPVEAASSRLLLIVECAAYRRVGGKRTATAAAQVFHLPSALQSIAVALRDCEAAAEACKVYRLAKSLELLCEAIRLDNAGQLLEMGGQGTLSSADTQRVLAARRLIDEALGRVRLTLQAIARACG
jgi:AraC family transcriptional activator of pyochelin receptor